jgi:hypothetical protein
MPMSNELKKQTINKVASKLLELAADRFGDAICNDLPNNFYENFTQAERDLLNEHYQKWEDDKDATIENTCDFVLMYFIAERIMDK